MIKLNINEIIKHIELSVSNADKNISKITPDILDITGFSGIKTRHLYNNLCQLDGINYLEIGTYLGSTFVSAMYENNIYGIAVDNWSEFDGSEKDALRNISKYITNEKYHLVSKDFNSLNLNDFNNRSIDIFLYDGCHKYESHKNAILKIQDYISDLSIIIVDDFRGDGNWKGVVDGTYDGFADSLLTVKYEKICTSKQESQGRTNYWNGCGIFICQK